jgi:tape measure domain-containing protein
MSDKISIVYDADIVALKEKLQELIDKNNQLKIAAAGASRAISDMTAAKKDFGSKIAITTKNITDNSISIRTNTKNIQENTLSISSSTKATQNNTSVVNTATNSYNSYSSAVNNASNASGGFKASTNLLTRAFQMLTARMVAFFAIDSMVSFGKELVNVERKFEILQNRINFVAGTTTGGEAIFSRLQRTANDLGIGIEELTNGFSGFAIAAKMAGFSSATAEDIFSKVATSLRAAGANSLQTQRAFYALQQMLSKGVVAAEELRRQLGEALPGASDLMTRAYNRLHPGQELTNRQFTKMLEDGKIISAEILPEFARVLEQEFAPALSGKKNSLDATLTRISNQFVAFKMNLSNLDFLKNTFSGLALFLEDINNVMTNEELSFSETVDGLMRAGTRFNQFEIEQQKKLASQGSFLAKYYLSGQRVLEESAEKARKRVEEQAKNEAILLKNAEKQYEAYKKLNEIEQSRLETSLQMRITLSDKDIAELSTESKAIRDLYDEIGKTVGITSEKWNMYAEAGAKVVKQQLRNAMSAKGLWNITKKELDAVNSFDKRLKQKTEENKQLVKSTKATQEQDKALSDLIKTRRVADAQGSPAGGGADEANKQAIKNAEEAMFKAKNAVEEAIVAGDSLENQEKLMTDYIDAVAAYKILKDKAGAEESKNIRIQAEKEVALFALKIDLDLLKAKKANLEIEGKSITQINKDIAAKQAQIDVLGAQSQAESLREQAEANLAFREQELKEELEIRTKDLTSFIAAQQEKIDATKEGSKERLDLELSVLKAQESIEHKGVRFSLKSEEDKQIEINKIVAKYTKLRRQLTEKYNKDVEQEVQKSQDKIVDILQRANDLIERNEGDTFNRRIARTKQMFEKMARDIKEAMSQTQDFEVLGELTKALGEVEVAGKKATDSIELERASEIIGGVANVYSEIAKLQSTAYDNEEIALKRQLEQKLISEQEYERKAAELAKKRFEHEKKAATVSAIIDGALGVVKAIGKGRWWEVAAITAATGIQIATIQSQQFPGFKEGVIDLQGPGTATSDSIPARLSRGESVMTAEETTKYKPVLQAIRDNEFEAFVAKRYTDVMRKQSGNAGLGSSFAENVSNSFDMQTAELATLLKQNRRVAIKNVDEFAKAISRRSTTDKVINRRRFK